MQVIEIFNSIDGEVNKYGQGCFSTFIRLAGCNLACDYCDTPNSQSIENGENIPIGEIVRQVVSIGCKKVTITGGEPLYHRPFLTALINHLLLEGHKITIETNGTLPFNGASTQWEDFPVYWVVDWKFDTNGRGFPYNDLTRNDWVKIIISDRHDFREAQVAIRILKRIGCCARIAFSPCSSQISPETLFKWIQEAELWDISLNIQLHKLINLP